MRFRIRSHNISNLGLGRDCGGRLSNIPPHWNLKCGPQQQLAEHTVNSGCCSTESEADASWALPVRLAKCRSAEQYRSVLQSETTCVESACLTFGDATNNRPTEARLLRVRRAHEQAELSFSLSGTLCCEPVARHADPVPLHSVQAGHASS